MKPKLDVHAQSLRRSQNPKPKTQCVLAQFELCIPEFLDLSLQGFAASEQVVVMQQCSVKPALHLAGIQGVQTHCLLGGMYAAHVHACLQSLCKDTHTSHA